MAKSIVYDEDIINEVGKRSKQLVEKSKDVSKKMSNNFSGMTSHGVLTETIGDLGKNFNSFESVISKTANAFYKHGSEMFDFDRRAALEIEDVLIPQDFVENNSMEINTYNASILSKIDGKAISKDKGTDEASYDDKTVVAAENIFDMTTKDTEEKTYDDTTIIGKSILGNVNGGTTNQKELDDSTSIGNTRLETVNGGVTNEQTYNNNVSINSVSLDGIEKGETKKQNFDESTIIGESILGNNDDYKSVDELLAALSKDNNINVSTDETRKDV